ncbi:TetR/AcrR family transcriptional regulator [Methylocaldum sp.]|uniref:TetR/AcrR family transcriptional regulator n=1 Tax=Methylocaldum sp. TaxID=1969727 RepID=UPI002D6813C8|nr:TetR/AcrR family transcriptional regulator [Methylocaldum sp.]HYE37970.1 TetR/AcrR family transcriptional regulator [Methylocaldum sp.]
MNKASNPKRQAILDAAKHAFLAHGYSGASMEAIAEAAPVSKPTLYNHFHGKQELFAAVIAGQCEAFLRTLSRAQTELRDPAAGLKAIAGAFVDLIYAREALDLYRLIIAEQQSFPELGELVYRSGPEPVLKRLSAYLNELDRRSALRIPDVNTSSRLLLGMLQGDEHLRCLLGLQPGLSEAEKERLIDSAVSLFLKGHGYDA